MIFQSNQRTRCFGINSKLISATWHPLFRCVFIAPFGGWTSCQNGYFFYGSSLKTALPRQPTSFVVALVTRTYVQYAYWRKRVLLICFGFAILQWRRGVPNPTFTRAVPPNTPFATWLMSQLLHLIATEGWAGPLLPSFVSKLWAIWLTRKTQVFRQERATIKKLQHHIQLDQHQHSSFSVKPSTLLAGKCCVSPPPGFHYAHFGRLRQTPPMATFQLFGTWDKRYMKVGVAWIVDVHDDTPTLGTGQQIFASSKLHTILQSCILALFWAQSRLLSHILVHSDSTSLIRLLHTNSSSDFNTPTPSLRWGRSWITLTVVAFIKFIRVSFRKQHISLGLTSQGVRSFFQTYLQISSIFVPFPYLFLWLLGFSFVMCYYALYAFLLPKKIFHDIKKILSGHGVKEIDLLTKQRNITLCLKCFSKLPRILNDQCIASYQKSLLLSKANIRNSVRWINITHIKSMTYWPRRNHQYYVSYLNSNPN